MKNIYIVISKTGTILCRILEFFTHEKYNHSSISLDDHLDILFSFGRLNPYIPWLGGYVAESPHFGTFKRFSGTMVRVISVSVSDEVYDSLDADLHRMFVERRSYHYDIMGLLLAAIHKVFRRENYFYCSSFVREMLVKYGIESPELFPEIVRPTDFLRIPDGSEIYQGLLRDFPEFADSVKTVNT